MEERNQRLYEEVGNAWRHFASWREKTVAGYLTVLAGLGLTFSHNVSAPVRAAILLGAIVISIAFWILDSRSNHLLNACQAAAARLENDRGGYSALARVRSAPRTWLTYGLAIDILVGGVVAAASGGLAVHLARLFDDPRGLLRLGVAAGALACLLVWVLRERERGSGDEISRANRWSPNPRRSEAGCRRTTR